MRVEPGYHFKMIDDKIEKNLDYCPSFFSAKKAMIAINQIWQTADGLAAGG